MAAALLYLVVLSVKQPPLLSVSQCMRHAGMSLITADNPSAQKRVRRLVAKLELKYVLSHVDNLLSGIRSYDHPCPVIAQGQPITCNVAQEQPSMDCTVTQGEQPLVVCTVVQVQPIHCAVTQDQTISYTITQEESSTDENNSIEYFSDLTSPTASFSDSSSLFQFPQASFKRTDVLENLLCLVRPTEQARITGRPGISNNAATSLSSSEPSFSGGISYAAQLGSEL
jgi:hypothetical protein